MYISIYVGLVITRTQYRGFRALPILKAYSFTTSVVKCSDSAADEVTRLFGSSEVQLLCLISEIAKLGWRGKEATCLLRTCNRVVQKRLFRQFALLRA